MYKVGITGGIGSGKSTVCNMLREMGVPVYDSDIRAKALMSQSEDLRQQLVAAFGEECYNAEGLDRGYLAQRAFGDKEALQRLNAIVHPAVRQDFRAWAEQQSAAYVVLESAILFEAAFDDEVDTTLAVLAPRELRVERTMQRDGVSREEVLRRMEHQAGDDFLHARAKRTLVNLNKEYLARDVEQLHKMLVYESQQ
jgi:dephospho-CoA kinase